MQRQMPRVIGMYTLMLLTSFHLSCTSGYKVTSPTAGYSVPYTTQRLSNYKNILIETIDTGPYHPTVNKKTFEMSILKIFRLEEYGRGRHFVNIYIDTENPGLRYPDVDLHFLLKIVDYRATTPLQRLSLGPFAGSSRIIIDIQVIDLRTNERIGTMEAISSSYSAIGSVEYGVERAYGEIIAPISNFIQKNF